MGVEEGGADAKFDFVAGVVSENRLKAEYEPVLYPSGTDLRMRMPTDKREDWIGFGRVGG